MTSSRTDRRTLLAVAAAGLTGAAVGVRTVVGQGTGTPEASPEASPSASPGASPTAGQAVAVELGEYYVKPAETTFTVGAPYTFVVTNAGAEVHEFVIEPAGSDEEAALESAAGEEGELEDIAPGATQQLTWTFTEAGDFQFACHLADHYELGMVVEITVEA